MMTHKKLVVVTLSRPYLQKMEVLDAKTVGLGFIDPGPCPVISLETDRQFPNTAQVSDVHAGQYCTMFEAALKSASSQQLKRFGRPINEYCRNNYICLPEQTQYVRVSDDHLRAEETVAK